MRRGARGAVLAGLALAAAFPAAAQPEEEEEEEAAELWEQLTEREDKRRPLEPFQTPLFGHWLTLGGEYEVAFAYVRPRVLESEVDGTLVRERDQLVMEQELQLEAFWTLGEPLSLFVQFQGVWEEDLLGRTFEDVSTTYLERGEMWVYSEDVLGSGLDVELGRLHFEDDRRWWWDEDLDAARVVWEREELELALAVAYEIGSDRSDESFVEPEHERVLRYVAEGSWDFSPGHSLQLFLVHHDDHSRPEHVGDTVAVEREDDDDARLTWLGARQTGIFSLGARGLLGYWLDAALVDGSARESEYADPVDGRAEVESIRRREVRGWGFDAGLDWLLPLAHEPRLFAAYAYGSGDATTGGDDRAFRQTGLETNEAGFGGVERFPSYGLLLQPELSNLGVVTLGAGIALFASSSLDLVYHHYRLDEPNEDLRSTLLQVQLDGRHRDLGDAVDLVLAVEEWERFEFDVALSALRSGPAFGDEAHRWVVGGFLAVRYAF